MLMERSSRLGSRPQSTWARADRSGPTRADATPETVRLMSHGPGAAEPFDARLAAGGSRNSRRRILPTLVLGSSVRNSTYFGMLVAGEVSRWRGP